MLKENAFILVAFAIGVLILILMEHAQRDLPSFSLLRSQVSGLNPYFNGTCSKRTFNKQQVC